MLERALTRLPAARRGADRVAPLPLGELVSLTRRSMTVASFGASRVRRVGPRARASARPLRRRPSLSLGGAVLLLNAPPARGRPTRWRRVLKRRADAPASPKRRERWS